MELHLVDGTFELFRAFYGSPPRRTSAGREVGATRSLLRSLHRLLRDGATHVGVAFDHVIESFRNDLFPGYKTGDGIDPALRSQFELAEEAALALGLVVWPMVDFEADDALAAAAVRWAPDVERVIVCSPDKDLTQVVRGERIVTLDRIRGTRLDEAGVVAKFGVPPASIPDYLALVGDSADGIPGIPRWGAKSAATVLARYGRIEAIPSDPARWDVSVRGAKTLSANLEAQREDALLYRALATLRLDTPLPQTDIEELRWRGPQADRLAAFLERIEDNGFAP